MPPAIPGLHALARAWGVQTAYYDIDRRRRRADPDVLLRVLAALGAPVARAADVADARAARQAERAAPGIDPVVVAWDGRPGAVALRLPAGTGAVDCTITREDGEESTWRCAAASLEPLERAAPAGGEALRLELPGKLAPGYHRLRVEANGAVYEALIIAAPRRAWHTDGRSWGVFLPLHALRTARMLGVADLSDLDRLAAWAGGRGASLVATLPLLAAFLGEEPFEPSPYAPASRLFWNELYVDPRRAPGFAECAEARAILDAPDFRAQAAALSDAPLVEYRRAAALRRRLLEPLARAFDPGRDDPAAADYRAFLAERPDTLDYARFMAVTERRGHPWPLWPEPLRGGAIPEGERDDAAVRFHAYAQWLANRQLAGFAEARPGHAALYLDLPLGVHRDGYDVWRHRALFAEDASAGAPPDPLFTGGQDWGFPPLKPEAQRRHGYAYTRAVLRTLMGHAGMLRLDHVMSLHRLYWVPRGVPATDGVYVRYPYEELYAVLCLESHRSRTPVVGEDLGTVPAGVRAEMRRRAVRRMFIVQFEASAHGPLPIHAVPPGAVAGVNTHDMPSFAAFWSGADLEDRRSLGLIDSDAVRAELATRHRLRARLAGFLTANGSLDGPATPAAVLRALLRWLGRGPARVVLVTLEDLWLEEKPQNTPGTWRERPNWRRRARHTLEEIARLPEVRGALDELDAAREPDGRNA